MGFVLVCAYLSHAALQNLQARLRLQEVFFRHCWCEGKTNAYSRGGKRHICLATNRPSRRCSQLRRFLYFRTVGRLVLLRFPASPALAATSAAVMLCSFWRIRKVSAGPTTLETQRPVISSGTVTFQIARRARLPRPVPDIDEAAGGQVNPVSQQPQQLHSVVQTQQTGGGRVPEAWSSSGAQRAE